MAGILFQDDLAACSITAAPRPPTKKRLFPDRLRGCIKRGALWGIPRVDLRKEMGGGDGARGWGRSSFAGCSAPLQASRRPWLSLHPAPGVCPAGRWQATGSRARPGRVLAPRGRRRRLQPSLGRLDGAHPGALPGPSALALSGQSLVQLRGSLGRGAAEKADGATEQTVPLWWTEKKETGARLRWRLHSREKAECHHPVDLSTRNRQFGLETWVQGCSF